MKIKLFYCLFAILLATITAHAQEIEKAATYPQTVFSKNLKKGDELSLSYVTTGCFHYASEKMVFKSTDEGVFGYYYKGKEAVKFVELTAAQLKVLINFEEKLRRLEMKLGGCTTNDSYSFTLNNDTVNTFRFVEDTCSWDSGFSELKAFFE